jgi:hypothetical protein
MTMPAAHFKRAIEDAILAALNGCQDLSRVRAFVRGVLPDVAIPQELYPLCECYILREEPTGELTGNYYQQVYRGALVFAALLTYRADADLIQRRGGRITHVPSYDLVDELVWAALQELQQCQYRDLGGLEQQGERVLLFAVGPEVTYGLVEADRSNSWALTATVNFSVETEREV